jgi:RHS repeat-associated protein
MPTKTGFAYAGLRRRIVPAIAFIVLVAASAQRLNAQGYIYEAGTPTFTTADSAGLGIVNVSNGNLHLEIPLADYPQRGSLRFSTKLVYDSRIWKVVSGTWQPTNVANSQGGWRLITTANQGSVGVSSYSDICGEPPHGGSFINYSFSWTGPDGTKHSFAAGTTKYTNCDGEVDEPTSDGLATDSSGYHIYITSYTNVTKILAKDGTQVYPTLRDTNGNYFSTDANGNAIDTLGRTPIVKTQSGNTTTYTILNSQNASNRTIQVVTKSISVATAFAQSGVTEYSGTLTVLDKVTLPDGSSYIFSYDDGAYGLLTGIKLPGRSLGTTQYDYAYTTFADAFSNKNRWVSSRTIGSGTWTYTPAVISSCSSSCRQKVTITKPSGDQVVHTFQVNTGGSWSEQTDYKTSGGTVVASATTTYDYSDPSSRYIRAITQTRTDQTPGGGITTKKTFTYDSPSYGNLIEIGEWNYYTGTPSANPDRKTTITYKHQSDTNFVSANMLDRVSSVQTKNGADTVLAETKTFYDTRALTDAGTVAQHDATFGTGYTLRGNPTTIQQYATVGGACPGTSCYETKLTYDTTGQVRQIQGSLNNTTTLSYADNFYHDTGSNPPSAYTPPAATNAYLTQVTTPLVGSTTAGYYFNTGKLAFSTDPNADSTYLHYLDVLDRQTHTYAPGGGWLLTQYAWKQLDFYTAITSTTPSTSCTSCRHDQTKLDDPGRVIQNQLVSDPEGAAIVATTYDSSSRVASISNPYRSVTEPTYGTQQLAYDALDRVTTVTAQDSSTAQMLYGTAISSPTGNTSRACTGVAAYPSLTIDASGKKREVWSDAFGRVVEANEPDGSNNLTIHTCYTYDLLDNLLTAEQRGGTADTTKWRTRTYTYDALSRVVSESIPESGSSGSATGTTNLYYTTSSGALCSGDSQDVCRRTDSRSITTTYSYDGVNRLTSKSYSNGDPTVIYYFDQTTYNSLTIANGKGRRTGMSDGSGQTAWSYDSDGRVVTERRTITAVSPSVTKTTSYSYNLDGSVASVTYPSGKVVQYTYSNAGRPLTAKDSLRSDWYAKDAFYTPWGALSEFKSGATGTSNGATRSFSFNNRLLPSLRSASSASLTIQSLNYTYLANGNVSQIRNNRDDNRTVNYTYDNLNRIKDAYTPNSTLWGNSYVYDNWGNLLQKNAYTGKANYEGLTVTVNRKNQVDGMTYDLAGNLTNDGLYSYVYNAENQTTSAAGVTFKYDGDNKRVYKSGSRLYWNGVGYAPLSETDLLGAADKDYVYFNGVRVGFLKVSTSTPYYYFPDVLGSATVMSNVDGTSIKEESDFYPYGGEQVITDLLSNNYKFTTYERDSESGNDYAIFRQYSTRLGRFGSPDALAGSVMDPHSLNRYSYVLDNPTNFVDLLGLYVSNEKEEKEKNDAVNTWPSSSCSMSSGLLTLNFAACPNISSLLRRVKQNLKKKLALAKKYICGGGGFAYGGAAGELGPEKGKLAAEWLGLIGWDSKDGGYHGGIVGGGAGRFTGGFESIRTWRDWQEHRNFININEVGKIPGERLRPAGVTNEWGFFVTPPKENGTFEVGLWGGGHSPQTARAAGAGGYFTIDPFGQCSQTKETE